MDVYTEVVFELLEPECHVVYDAVVVRGHLVVHGPAAAHELQPALGHQVVHKGLHLGVLVAVPLPEERSFDLMQDGNIIIFIS